MPKTQEYSWLQKALAWSVHLFTASGLLAAFMSILAINEQDWQMAMVWLIVCQIIDGVDGTFARLFKVKEVLPNMDGKTIDYVIDFVSYAVVPAYFIYQAGLLEPPFQIICTFVILLVSALYYGKEGMVSEDYYFVGFPVMWNMVVFFLVFVYDFTPLWNAILIFIFAILHFVPIKFVYPSRGYKYRWLTLTMTAIAIILAGITLFIYPEKPPYLVLILTLTLAYYGVRAVLDTLYE